MSMLEHSSRNPSDLAGAWCEARQGRDLASEPDRRRDGWWFLPAVVLGALLWVLIIRALVGWLA
jgi:hypothetical protein